MPVVVVKLFLILFFSPVALSEEWHWNDLLPVADGLSHENKFSNFTLSQYQDLTMIQQHLASPENSENNIEFQRAVTRFEKDGIDIVTLIKIQNRADEKRKQWNMKTNDNIVGKRGRLLGFVVPLEFNNIKVSKFILVPTAGACIHTPPPPANQMVLVSYPEGFEFETLYEPVWIDGVLLKESNVQNIQFSDGSTDIASTYAMSASRVTLFNK
jgi:hypothetical protein